LSATTNANASSPSAIGSSLQALAKALQSGSLNDAQQAFTQLEQALGRRHHGHHHHHEAHAASNGATAAALPVAPTPSPAPVGANVNTSA
jgi:hypothetical protein